MESGVVFGGLGDLWGPEVFELPAAKVLTFDLETNMAHNVIWMVGWSYGETKGYSRTPEEFKEVVRIAKASGVAATSGHNTIKFDLPVLLKVWGIDLQQEFQYTLDTLVISRLMRSNEMMHSLKWLAKVYFGADDQKDEFTDFDGGFTEEMASYCMQDVKVTEKLLQMFFKKAREGNWGPQSFWLEHEVAKTIKQQVDNGFLLDMQAAMVLYAKWAEELKAIVKECQELFPPVAIQMKTKVKYEPFKISSRVHCATRLQELGWVPETFTEIGRPKLDDDALDSIADLGHPVALKIARYFKLAKAQSMVHSWFTEADSEGRVHGGVNSNGAVTGRMTHSKPNLANIPKKDEEIGPLCRGLFKVPEGKVLVGADASGLELRMFAHYIQDSKYTEALLGGDPHTFTQKAAGLPTRDDAKTFIYALLYGAQEYKLGTIKVGSGQDKDTTKRVGAKLMADFSKALPGLPKLKNKLLKFYVKAVPSFDGRWIPVRSKHALLNSLLQGAGAVVMKMALVLADRQIKAEGLDALFVVNVHDEFQLECSAKDGPRVALVCTEAIKRAGEVLGVRCPLAGEANIGRNWHETH